MISPNYLFKHQLFDSTILGSAHDTLKLFFFKLDPSAMAPTLSKSPAYAQIHSIGELIL